MWVVYVKELCQTSLYLASAQKFHFCISQAVARTIDCTSVFLYTHHHGHKEYRRGCREGRPSRSQIFRPNSDQTMISSADEI